MSQLALNSAPPSALAPTSRPYDHVIDALRALSRNARLQYTLSVGDLLLREFWDNDIFEYSNRQKETGSGFESMLKERADDLEDLQLPAATLRRHIRATIVWRQLPNSSREQLDLPVLNALTEVPDTTQRARFAMQAAQEQLRGKEMKARIGTWQQSMRRGERRGPKPSPQAVKEVRQALTGTTKVKPAEVVAASAQLDARGREALVKQLQETQAWVAEVLGKLVAQQPV